MPDCVESRKIRNKALPDTHYVLSNKSIANTKLLTVLFFIFIFEYFSIVISLKVF